MKKIKKPEPHKKKVLDWHEVQEYINKLTGKSINNWNEDQSFWRWLIENQEINKGADFDLYEPGEYDRVENPSWVLEIYDLIFKEFAEYIQQDSLGDNCLKFNVNW